MSNKKARKELAKSLSEHLSVFGDQLSGKLLCPTCMKMFDSSKDTHLLTAGHIIPEASGGKEWTLLCKTCNSEFGSKQDKWFGEYLIALTAPNGTFLHAKTMSKYVSVNGETVSGKVFEKDGEVHLLLPTNRNQPGKVESIPFGNTLEIEFSPEMVKHVNEIQVGYITAAYLLWFHKIGYNWVMQSSLGGVRHQILECNYDVSGAVVLPLACEGLQSPAIGVIFESGFIYPCCLMYDRVVIFPSPSINDAPSLNNISFNSSRDVGLIKLEKLDFPYAVGYEGEIVVFPDLLKKQNSFPEYMMNIPASNDAEPQWYKMKEKI